MQYHRNEVYAAVSTRMLEKNDSDNQKLIKHSNEENSKLKTDIQSINKRYNQLKSECDRKFTQYSATHKLMNQQSKYINEFDFGLYTKKVTTIESKNDRLAKLNSTSQKSVNELKLSCKNSYAHQLTKNSPSGSPDPSKLTHTSNKVNSTNHTTQRVTQSETLTSSSSNGYSVLKQTDSRDTSAMINGTQCESKIPVIVAKKTGDNVQANEHTVSDPNYVFIGVTRKWTSRYHLSGIDPKSTRYGIISFLEKRNVQVTYFRLFKY